MWSGIGAKIKMGVDLTMLFETFVHGDVVLQVYQPPNRRIWNNWLKTRGQNALKSIETFDVNLLYKAIIEEKDDIWVFAHRNPDLAEKVKKEAMEHFK